tara:strand:+ start:769 stop:1101 length:333 start_codon:yes stop_codon:yes gene_type:complete
MKYKVKIAEVNKSINLMHHSTIDLGIFAVKATTHTFLFPALKTDWGADINETETEFELNGKRCSYVGFKELYDKLYHGSFVTFEADLIRQIEEEVAKRIVKEYPGCKMTF